MQVEVRPVPWEEVETFREVAACGTAVVLTPIQSLTRGDKVRRGTRCQDTTSRQLHSTRPVAQTFDLAHQFVTRHPPPPLATHHTNGQVIRFDSFETISKVYEAVTNLQARRPCNGHVTAM